MSRFPLDPAAALAEEASKRPEPTASLPDRWDFIAGMDDVELKAALLALSSVCPGRVDAALDGIRQSRLDHAAALRRAS